MYIIMTIALLGFVQTALIMPRMRGFVLPIALYSLFSGSLVYFLHPWVQAVSFNQLTEFLLSEFAVFYISFLLALECFIKGLVLLIQSPRRVCPYNNSVTGAVYLWRQSKALFIKVCPYVPALPFLLFVFYGQAWVFHSTERIAFSTLSFLISLGVTSIFIGSTFLFKQAQSYQLERTAYDLLFLQLILAVVLPTIASGKYLFSNEFEIGTLIHTISTLGVMLVCIIMGYVLNSFLKYKRQEL